MAKRGMVVFITHESFLCMASMVAKTGTVPPNGGPNLQVCPCVNISVKQLRKNGGAGLRRGKENQAYIKWGHGSSASNVGDASRK